MQLGLIACAIAIVAVMGAGIGIGLATGKAVEAVSRQPEASGKIQTVLLLGAALSEATAIYALVMAILIFVKI